MSDKWKKELEASIAQMLAQLNAKVSSLPYLFGDNPFGDGTPWIEYSDNKYHYVISERGTEYSRESTTDIQELLFWIFEGVTFGMSVQWELENRKPKEDCRRQIFAKQEELLSRLNPKWKDALHEEHKEILKVNPFNDNRSLMVDYLVELRNMGFEYEEALEIAEEKFPDLADSNW